nr:protein THEM6 isoform X2 [Zootoca vivipara]
MAELAWALGALAALFALLDGWYLLRVPVTLLYARWALPTVWDLLEEQSFASRVLPSDLDCLVHMNNARYPREADLARLAHLTRCGLLRAVRGLGAHTVLASSTCRYRRSLHLLERFDVESPELPEDIQHWLKYNEVNSQKLRAESDLQENNKEE